MSLLHELRQRATCTARKVILAEAADERIIRAAEVMAAQGLATPILTGNADEIRAIAASCGVSLDRIEVCEPGENERDIHRYAKLATQLRRPLELQTALQQMREALIFSAMKVHTGEAYAMVAGASVSTAEVIKAGLKIIGTLDGIETASSYFLMRIPAGENKTERFVVFADCAVNIEPNSHQLAQIVVTTAASAKQLLPEKIKIAMLSFSTKGSARHERVDHVTQALEMVKQQCPNLAIDGEFQFDTAFDSRTASFKIKESNDVAGSANVFIFPDLNSGNIGYKIAQYIGGAQAIGPILQGFAKPISDLSRGATVDDIVNTTAVLLAASENHR